MLNLDPEASAKLLKQVEAEDAIYAEIAEAEEKHRAEATDPPSLISKAIDLLSQAATQEAQQEGDLAADLAAIVSQLADLLSPFLENPNAELRRAALDHRGLP